MSMKDNFFTRGIKTVVDATGQTFKEKSKEDLKKAAGEVLGQKAVKDKKYIVKPFSERFLFLGKPGGLVPVSTTTQARPHIVSAILDTRASLEEQKSLSDFLVDSRVQMLRPKKDSNMFDNMMVDFLNQKRELVYQPKVTQVEIEYAKSHETSLFSRFIKQLKKQQPTIVAITVTILIGTVIYVLLFHRAEVKKTIVKTRNSVGKTLKEILTKFIQKKVKKRTEVELDIKEDLKEVDKELDIKEDLKEVDKEPDTKEDLKRDKGDSTENSSMESKNEEIQIEDKTEFSDYHDESHGNLIRRVIEEYQTERLEHPATVFNNCREKYHTKSEMLTCLTPHLQDIFLKYCAPEDYFKECSADTIVKLTKKILKVCEHYGYSDECLSYQEAKSVMRLIRECGELVRSRTNCFKKGHKTIDAFLRALEKASLP